MGKESACNERDAGDTGDMSLIPGSGRSPRGGNCNPLQDSCLKIPIDRGVWQATALRVTKHCTRVTKHRHTNTVKHLHILLK